MVGAAKDVEGGVEDGLVEVNVIGGRLLIGHHEVLAGEAVVMFKHVGRGEKGQVDEVAAGLARHVAAHGEGIVDGDADDRLIDAEPVAETLDHGVDADVLAIAIDVPMVGQGVELWRACRVSMKTNYKCTRRRHVQPGRDHESRWDQAL